MLLRSMEDKRRERMIESQSAKIQESEKTNDLELEDDFQRLWLVVKHQRAGDVQGRYELRGGERIRLGRIVFHVKELVNERFQYQSQEDIFGEYESTEPTGKAPEIIEETKESNIE